MTCSGLMIRRRGQLDIAGPDGAFAFLVQGKVTTSRLCSLKDDALQVEQDIDDIFLDAIDRGVLVSTPIDGDFRRAQSPAWKTEGCGARRCPGYGQSRVRTAP